MRKMLVPSFLLILGLFVGACGARQARVRAMPDHAAATRVETEEIAVASSTVDVTKTEPAVEDPPPIAPTEKADDPAPAAEPAADEAADDAQAKAPAEPRHDGAAVRAKAKAGRRVRPIVREASDLPASGILTDAAVETARQGRDGREADVTAEADETAKAVAAGFLDEAVTAKPPPDPTDKGASAPAEKPFDIRDYGFIRRTDAESLAALGRLLKIFVLTVFAAACLFGVALVLRRGRPLAWPSIEDSSFRLAPSSDDETLANGWFEEGPATDCDGVQSHPAPMPALDQASAAPAAPPFPTAAASPPAPAAPSAPAAASAAPPAQAAAPPTLPADDVRAAARPKLFLVPPPAEPPPAPPKRPPTGSGHLPEFDLSDVNGEIESPAPKPPPPDFAEILPSTVLIDDETLENSLAPSA